MSIDKSELKILMVTNLGADIEDQLEQEQRHLYQLEGSISALKEAAVAVPRDICAKIQQSLDKGEIKDMSAPQVAEYAKKQVTKVYDFLLHLAEVQRMKTVTQGGVIAGIKLAMTKLASLREKEQEKLKAQLEILESQVAGGNGESAQPTPAPAVDRPRKMSLKQRRLAAQAAGELQPEESPKEEPPKEEPPKEESPKEEPPKEEPPKEEPPKEVKSPPIQHTIVKRKPESAKAVLEALMAETG